MHRDMFMKEHIVASKRYERSDYMQREIFLRKSPLLYLKRFERIFLIHLKSIIEVSTMTSSRAARTVSLSGVWESSFIWLNEAHS